MSTGMASKPKKTDKPKSDLCILNFQDSIMNPTDCRTLCVHAEKSGFTAAVIAPLFHRMYPSVTMPAVRSNVENSLKIVGDELSPGFGLEASAVMVLGEGSVLNWAVKSGVLPEDESQWQKRPLLIKFFTDFLTPGWFEALRTLKNYGLQPIVCLPELLTPVGTDPWKRIAEKGIDVEFAVDLYSLGGNNSEHRAVAARILAEGNVTLLGTRFQNSSQVDEALAGIDVAKGILGDERVSEILSVKNVGRKTGVLPNEDPVTTTSNGDLPPAGGEKKPPVDGGGNQPTAGDK